MHVAESFDCGTSECQSAYAYNMLSGCSCLNNSFYLGTRPCLRKRLPLQKFGTKRPLAALLAFFAFDQDARQRDRHNSAPTTLPQPPTLVDDRDCAARFVW